MMNIASASSFTTTSNGVEVRALARAVDQQAGDHRDDEDGGQVDDSAELGPLDEAARKRRADARQEPRSVARPADRDRADDQAIFEDQRPADDPGDQLAEHDVAVGVGAARRRIHRRHLGISERREGADHARDGEAEDDRRAGLGGADAGQGQDARADDRADAERDQVRPGERLVKPMLFRHVLASDDRLADVPVLHDAPLLRHCERSEAIQSAQLDCLVAKLSQ